MTMNAIINSSLLISLVYLALQVRGQTVFTSQLAATKTLPQSPSASTPPSQQVSVTGLGEEIKKGIDSNTFEGYASIVFAFIDQCSSRALQKYDQDRPTPPFAVNVRNPMEAYVYQKMAPYAYTQYIAIRKENKPSGPIAAQSARDLITMCNELNDIGRIALEKFELALNKPGWGPTANIA